MGSANSSRLRIHSSSSNENFLDSLISLLTTSLCKYTWSEINPQSLVVQRYNSRTVRWRSFLSKSSLMRTSRSWSAGVGERGLTGSNCSCQQAARSVCCTTLLCMQDRHKKEYLRGRLLLDVVCVIESRAQLPKGMHSPGINMNTVHLGTEGPLNQGRSS